MSEIAVLFADEAQRGDAFFKRLDDFRHDFLLPFNRNVYPLRVCLLYTSGFVLIIRVFPLAVSGGGRRIRLALRDVDVVIGDKTPWSADVFVKLAKPSEGTDAFSSRCV